MPSNPPRDPGATVCPGDEILQHRFVCGEQDAVRVIDSWIDVVLRNGFLSLREDWDDLRQETRMRVLRNLLNGRFERRSSLRTYVHRIARNVCIDSTRLPHRRREKQVDWDRSSAQSGSIQSPLGAILARDLYRKILSTLSRKDRRLVDLVFGQHLSYAETASTLGISEGAVKVRMLRCKRRILKVRRNLLHQKGATP